MKNIVFIIFLSISSFQLFGQCSVDRFCLNFANPQIVMGGTHFEFDLVVSSNSDFGLGSSNLQFKYNNAALATPIVVSTVIASPTYQTPSITTPFIPAQGEMIGSFNVELNAQGTGVNIPSGGLTVCRIRFNITDPSMSSTMSWFYSGGTNQTIVYDHDEATQLCAVDPGVTCLQPSSTILPLDLVDFKSTAYAESILLEWKTENEQNASHFEIQRSIRGENFSKINRTLTTNETMGSSYNYEDKNVLPEVEYYYRLKMVDFDGLYTYSKVITNRISQEVRFEVYPNPVAKNESFFIKLNTPLEYNFTLLDAKRSIIMSSNYQQSTEIDVESLSSGVYFYRIEYNGIVKSGKLVIQ